MPKVEKLIDGLLKLQDAILEKEKDMIQEFEVNKAVGNVAQIEVYDDKENYSVRLKLDENLRIVKTDEEPMHLIRMHVDTLVDLILGERGGRPFDFGRAYAEGHIEFMGIDYHLHAMKMAKAWEKAFYRIRKYLR